MQALRSTFYLILTLSTSAFAQDMRTVAEPRLPKICTVIKAALTAQDGQLPDVAEEHLDTERLQDAIDHCTPGQALELAKDGAQDAFLSGP
jgi:polygalacturonase